LYYGFGCYLKKLPVAEFMYNRREMKECVWSNGGMILTGEN